MSKQLIQVPASVQNMNPRADRSWKLVFETGRELTGEEVKLLTDNFQGEGWLLFSPNEIQTADVPDVDVEETGKKPSQRLRNVIYRLWEHQGSHGDFEMFYRVSMERAINNVKERLG